MNPEKLDEKGQMMTLEALIASMLIIGAVLFMVSQVPSHIQPEGDHAEIQLKHYGTDIINLLKESPSPDKKYSNLLQYYVSEDRYDELDTFMKNSLPGNIGYSVELYSREGTKLMLQNGDPREDGVKVKEMIATRNSTFGWLGVYRKVLTTQHNFSDRSLIIPMDDKQNNNITAYNLVMKIAGSNIPVYQLLQDPRGKDYGYDWKWNITTSDNAWTGGGVIAVRDYAGGPYVIDAADLTPSWKDQIKYWADNPKDKPSVILNRIEFDNVISNKIVTVTFRLNDSSTRVIKLQTNDTAVVMINSTYSGTNAKFLSIDTKNLGYENDADKRRISGIVLINEALYSLKISNITVNWTITSGDKLKEIRIGGYSKYPSSGSPPSTVQVDYTIIYGKPENKVTVHESRTPFSYKYTTVMTESPNIAVYPKPGSLTSYYSDSGVPYTVITNSDILKGALENYNILTIPHESLTSYNMPDNVVKKVIDWVSSGGIIHAECASIDTLDSRVEAVDGAKHPWYGFIGVKAEDNSNTISFIGKTNVKAIGDTSGFYKETADPGAPFNMLAQVYTVDGKLPGIGGLTDAFSLYPSNYNPYVNIMAVPLVWSGVPDYPKITYIEAPFDKGTVIYFAGHDQSQYGQQRERVIFNSFTYAVTTKVYDYALSEFQITLWYK